MYLLFENFLWICFFIVLRVLTYVFVEINLKLQDFMTE